MTCKRAYAPYADIGVSTGYGICPQFCGYLVFKDYRASMALAWEVECYVASWQHLYSLLDRAGQAPKTGGSAYLRTVC